MIRYRRKDGDAPAPRKQTAYHLPLELLYTLVPFLIVGVLFFITVKAQDAMIDQTAGPDTVVNVVGQKWSWTFNYMEEDNAQRQHRLRGWHYRRFLTSAYLPVNKRVRFNLDSADVIHSFWIPTFYFKLDVIPGHPNSFDATPNKLGTFDGKCAELCGEFHARMIVFKVHIVTESMRRRFGRLAESGNAGTRTVQDAIQAVLPTAAPEEHK